MPEDKKIIIDEDWKSQVQAEKEAAKQSPGKSASPGLSSSKSVVEGKTPAPQAAGDEQLDPPMPPASFEMLVTTLATETLAALGQFPHPTTGKAELHRNHAQYLIDTLDVLRQKSQGNLTPAEQELLDSVLHQLRMVFIAVADQQATRS